MAKIIAVLTHNLTAKAGQALVKDETGRVLALDLDQMEIEWRSEPAVPFAPVEPKPVPAPAPAPAPAAAPSQILSEDRYQTMRTMFKDGATVSGVIRSTGVTRYTATRVRDEMVAEGQLRRLIAKKKATGHHYFRSPETLEKARQRGLALTAKNRARHAHKTTEGAK